MSGGRRLPGEDLLRHDHPVASATAVAKADPPPVGLPDGRPPPGREQGLAPLQEAEGLLRGQHHHVGERGVYLVSMQPSKPYRPGPTRSFAGKVVLFALAMRIFTMLAKPEKMAWMFDYRIDWDAPAT